ncbi:MAG: thiol-disulfide oxidoreductase DCC family protein [Oligoflexales bacterium]
MSHHTAKLKIYYDGLCIICASEIKAYQRWDKQGKLELVDISHPQFSAEAEGLDTKLVQKYLHIKTVDGRILTGVDSFVEIWRELNIFKLLARVAKNPFARKLFDFAYHGFVVVRPILPRRKTCNSHACDLK